MKGKILTYQVDLYTLKKGDMVYCPTYPSGPSTFRIGDIFGDGTCEVLNNDRVISVEFIKDLYHFIIKPYTYDSNIHSLFGEKTFAVNEDYKYISINNLIETDVDSEIFYDQGKEKWYGKILRDSPIMYSRNEVIDLIDTALRNGPNYMLITKDTTGTFFTQEDYDEAVELNYKKRFINFIKELL